MTKRKPTPAKKGKKTETVKGKSLGDRLASNQEKLMQLKNKIYAATKADPPKKAHTGQTKVATLSPSAKSTIKKIAGKTRELSDTMEEVRNESAKLPYKDREWSEKWIYGHGLINPEYHIRQTYPTKSGSVRIIQNKHSKQYYWHVVANNGNKLAWSGELYKNKKDCIAGMKAAGIIIKELYTQ